MSKKILLALAVLVVVGLVGVRFIPHAEPQKIEEGCTVVPFSGAKLEAGDLSRDLRAGVLCHFYIHEDLPIYTFHLKSSATGNIISQIEITQGAEGGPVLQTLDASMSEPPFSGQEFFWADQDINFDGYKDIRLLDWLGATGNTGYSYWLFDPIKKIFVRNDELNALSNPTPDPQSKTISASSNGGMAGCIYSTEKYKFDTAGRLIVVSSMKQDYDSVTESFVKTIGELKDGKMATRTVAGKCPGF